MLWAKSAVTKENRKPLIQITYEEENLDLTMDVFTARKWAEGILEAVAVSIAEAAIFKAFNTEESPKGFKPGSGKPSKAILMLRKMRENRPPLQKNIEVIYGAKSQEAIVNVSYLDKKITLAVDEAQHHALRILEAAESAEQDVFWYAFLEDEMDFESDAVEQMMLRFCLYRQQNDLENLLPE